MTASVERVLERLAIPAKRIGSRWWAERCPMPEHVNQNEGHRFKNFFARADGHRAAGLWHCYSCKAGGRLVELVMRVRGCEFREAVEWLRDVEDAPAPTPVVRVRYAVLGARERAFELPGGVEVLPFEEWNSVPRAYARGRGLDAAQVARWEVGYALEGKLTGRIVFPIRDSRGVLANYAARTFVGDETRVMAADERREHPDTSVMLGEAHWPSPPERARSGVIIFEGSFSGMAIERALRGRPATYIAGLQGSDVANPRRALRLSAFGRVVSACDPDSAGDRASLDLEAALRRVPFTRFRYPRKGVDAADEDPEALAAALTECLNAG